MVFKIILLTALMKFKNPNLNFLIMKHVDHNDYFNLVSTALSFESINPVIKI